MELEHEFTVPVRVEEAWPVLLDVERVAPCMPGATLDSVDGDEFTGRLKVKVGPVTVTYRGTAGFTYKDEESHAATIEASGKEARGSGTASATVRAQLHEEGESTRVTVRTELQVTGRPAQFGRNVMSDVGTKLIGKFADCLASQLAGQPDESEARTETTAESGTAADQETSAPPRASAETSSPPPAQPAQPAAASEPEPSQAKAHAAPVTSPDSSGGQSANGSGSSAGREAPSPPSISRPSPEAGPRGGEAVNLLEVAGGPVLKRALPALGGIAAILGIVFVVRRKRGH